MGDRADADVGISANVTGASYVDTGSADGVGGGFDAGRDVIADSWTHGMQ